MFTLKNQFSVNKQRIFRILGYPAGYRPSPRIESLLNSHIRNAVRLIKPSVSYVLRDIEQIQDSCVSLDEEIIFESRVISRLLESANKVAVFTLTIGSYLEDVAAKLAREGLVVQATLMDAIGSDAAERLADSVQRQVAYEASTQGLKISRRFSPGYCDWDVSQQKMVFRAMNGDCAGIQLTDSSLMIPRKSISGIIGIGSSDIEVYNPCLTCAKRDCQGRR